MTVGPPRRYIHSAYLDQLVTRLSDRDWQILADLWRCRVLTGNHITRLHFSNISSHTRDRTRRLVLARLTSWGILVSLDRRIGGVRGGSAGSVFSLDVAGRRLVALRWPEAVNAAKRFRRPWTPGQLFLAHALAISEVYVSLVEQSRMHTFVPDAFMTEPLSWWPDGLGGYIKPDAYLVLHHGERTLHTWLEVDRATESLPTIKRKLEKYLDFVNQGQLGPHDLIPQVVMSVPDERRTRDIQAIIEQLPAPADELFLVAEASTVTRQLTALIGQPP